MVYKCDMRGASGLLTQMFPTALLTTLFLAFSVAANPVVINKSPVTLPLSRRVNFTSIHNLVRHDQARAKALKAKGAAKAAGVTFHNDAVISSPADNQAVVYVATVGVGIPPTNCEQRIIFEVLEPIFI
jgi:cathepsin E